MIDTSGIRLFGDRSATDLFLQLADEHDMELMGSQAEALEKMACGGRWCLAAVTAGDWFHDLTPWSAPAVFGKNSFGDGAAETLMRLKGEALAKITDRLESKESVRVYIAGYSLAGLFALWASYQTDMFSGVAAASPSVWYPGWISYAEAAGRPLTSAVYLSLGDREEKTRNPAMAAVGDAIRRQKELLDAANVDCALEWNRGNHFVDSHLRTARAMAWLLGRRKKTEA